MTTPSNPDDAGASPEPSEVLSTDAAPVGPTSPPRRRGRAIAGALVLLLLVVGGAAYAAYATVLKPHGASPEEATPADALAFAKVDLDPSAGQKVAVYQLAKRFPDSKVKSDRSVTDDLLKSVFTSAGDDVDYDKDIKPWIGKRAAVAAIPGDPGKDPHPLIVVQYDDKAEAQKSLTRLTEKANADTPDEPVYFAFSTVNGYVVLSDTKEATDAAAQTKRHLDDESAYKRAVAKLDGDQIVTAWADVARIWAAVPKEELEDNPFFSVDDLAPSGQVVIGAHAESDALEVVGRTVGLNTGVKGVATSGLAEGKGTDMVQTFPDDSTAALSLTGVGAWLADAYTQNEKALRDLDAFGIFDSLDEAGIRLPGDFTAVLGTEIAAYFAGTEDDPRAALRVKTTNPDRARVVLKSLLGQATGDEPAPINEFMSPAKGGYVIGVPEEFLENSIAGRLGSSKAFKDAVPDATGASLLLYVDVPKGIALADEDVPAWVDRMRAVGVTAGSDADGGRFRLRVTFS